MAEREPTGGLRQCINDVLEDIVQADQAEAVCRVIGRHSSAVNESPFVHSLGTIQSILSDWHTLKVAGLYDRSRRHPTSSVPLLHQIIMDDDVEITNRQAIERDLAERMLLDPRRAGDLDLGQLRTLFLEYYVGLMPDVGRLREAPEPDHERWMLGDDMDLCRSLKRVLTHRNKRIAHSERLTTTLDPVYWRDTSALLDFAKRYISIVAFGFSDLILNPVLAGGQDEFLLTGDANRIGLGIEHLLRAAGVITEPGSEPSD